MSDLSWTDAVKKHLWEKSPASGNKAIECSRPRERDRASSVKHHATTPASPVLSYCCCYIRDRTSFLQLPLVTVHFPVRRCASNQVLPSQASSSPQKCNGSGWRGLDSLRRSGVEHWHGQLCKGRNLIRRSSLISSAPPPSPSSLTTTSTGSSASDFMF